MYGLLIIEPIVILLLLYLNSFLILSLKKRIIKIISNYLLCYNIFNIVLWAVMTSYLIIFMQNYVYMNIIHFRSDSDFVTELICFNFRPK